MHPLDGCNAPGACKILSYSRGRNDHSAPHMFIKYDLNIIIINFPDIYKILSGKFWLGGRTNQIGSSYIYIYIYI